MDSEIEVTQSLKSGQHTSCWDYNSVFLLRLTIHGMFIFLLFLTLIQIIMVSVFYHKINDNSPISITPYPDLFPNNDTISPCVYPRLDESFSLDNTCLYDTFCPLGWSCSTVADQESQDTTYVCLNDLFSCGDIHYCTNYIKQLSPIEGNIPAVKASVGISKPYYISSLLFLIFGLVVLLCLWILFAIWNFIIEDPFNPRDISTTYGISRSLYEFYDKIPKLSPRKLYYVNVLVASFIFLIFVIAGCSFIGGCSPRLYSVTDIAVANCFDDHWLYLFASSMMGWIYAFFITQGICCIGLWFFYSLYTVKTAFKSIWDPRVFLTIILLMLILVSIGIGIELVSIIIEAAS